MKTWYVWCEFDIGLNIDGKRGVYKGNLSDVQKMAVSLAEDSDVDMADELAKDGLITFSEFTPEDVS